MLSNSNMFHKYAVALSYVALNFLEKKPGDRADTVVELTTALNMARGTVQKSLKTLESSGAISLETHGHLGTLIKSIDYIKLINFTGIVSLVGVMPMPYSDRYEGLATGLSQVLNCTNINVNLAFMNGADQRVKLLLDGRYDFCVMSVQAAKHYIKNDYSVEIAAKMSPNTYVNEHRLIVRHGFTGIFPGMRIGVDPSSTDQINMTKDYFKEKEIEIVPLKYIHIIDYLKKQIIDGTIWSCESRIQEDTELESIQIFDSERLHDSTASAIVVRKGEVAVTSFLKKFLDLNEVEALQKQVIEKKITPAY